MRGRQPREELMLFTHLAARTHKRNWHRLDDQRNRSNLVCFSDGQPKRREMFVNMLLAAELDPFRSWILVARCDTPELCASHEWLRQRALQR